MVLHLVVVISLLASALAGTSTRVIYVDQDKGSLDPNCWTGGMNLPCKSYHLAEKGALLLKNKFNDIVEIIPHKNASCESYTWMYDSNDTCKCGKGLDYRVRCSYDHGGVHVSILTCSCMTYDEETARVTMGQCPYGCGQTADSSDVYYSLPPNVSELNTKVCGRHNRDSRFCSKCKNGSSPLVYTYDLQCIECNNSKFNWLKFIAIAFIPLTIFYFIVIFFRINATNPYLYGFILVNQALASPINLHSVLSSTDGRTRLIIRILAIPYTIWNLDFFRTLPLNICLDLTTLQTLALDYTIAVYPLVLLVITYTLIELHARGCRLVLWLWRPFHRCCVRFTRIMDIQSSIIKAFATFLLLSYVKLLDTTIGMLLPVKAKDVHGQVVGWYVYYDASYRYFHKDHLPYAIMGIACFLIFVLSPLVLLLIYPTTCFQRCLNICRLRSHALQVFVDTFQGHYKDGTEPGTRDCRWFAAVYFILRMVIFYVLFGISEDSMCYSLTGIGLLLFGTLLVILKPYRSRKVNTYHTMIIIYLAITTFTISIFHQATIGDYWIVNFSMGSILLLVFLPTLVITVYVVYYCIVHCCFKSCQRAGKVLSQQRRKRFRNLANNTEEENPLGSSITKSYHSINT